MRAALNKGLLRSSHDALALVPLLDAISQRSGGLEAAPLSELSSTCLGRP